MLGGAVRALLPVQEELAVAVSQTRGRIDVECGEGLVDPGGGAFEFGIVANGGLVDHQMGGGCRVDVGGVRPLGTVLLVDEGGGVAKLLKDLAESFALRDDGLGLDADLVAGGVDGVLLVGLALVRDRAERAVLANAQDLPPGTEIAIGGVVEGVVFEGARSDEVEAELGKAAL
jgi:hypothetical protein